MDNAYFLEQEWCWSAMHARVSTDDQNLSVQKDALLEAGCERIFEEGL